MNIMNMEAAELARPLAQLTGRDISDVVIEAFREKLIRVECSTSVPSLASEILEIGRHCASLPELDRRTDDEILGYNERGFW